MANECFIGGFLLGLAHLLADAGDPLLGAVAVLTGDDALIDDDIDIKLGALLKAGPNLLELVLDHEGQSLVQLHLTFLLDGVAGDLASLEDGLVGAAGTDLEQGTDTMTDGSDESVVFLPDALDDLVDVIAVGKIEEGSSTTGEDDTAELLRLDLAQLASVLDVLHGLVVLEELANHLVMLGALEGVGIKVALTSAGTGKVDWVGLLAGSQALVQISNLLDITASAVGLLLSQSKSSGSFTTTMLGELAGVGEDDEDLVALAALHCLR